MYKGIIIWIIVTNFIYSLIVGSAIENNYELKNNQVEVSDINVDSDDNEDDNNENGMGISDTNDEIEINIIETSITSQGLEYEIVNNTNFPYYINDSYTICIYKDGGIEELYKAPPSINEEKDPIEKYSSQIITIDWTKRIGTLERGKYILKLNKEISYYPRDYEEILIEFEVK